MPWFPVFSMHEMMYEICIPKSKTFQKHNGGADIPPPPPPSLSFFLPMFNLMTERERGHFRKKIFCV